MKVAIFSDVHGKFLLPFVMADLYQKETGEKIDFILQCGDLGTFPDLSTLDKATIRHAQRDRDELGFHDHMLNKDPKINAFLEKLDLTMYCVRGNHEDHDYLDKLEQASEASYFPIDCYDRVMLCKSALPQVLTVGDESLSFAGIGRIGDRKGREHGQFIQEYEKKLIQKLSKSKGIFDVLISHDKDSGSERGYGMDELTYLLDNAIFRYHFYGHTGEPFSQRMHENRVTTSVKVKEAEFGHTGILGKGSMVILEKKDDEINLKIAPMKLTNLVTKYNWKAFIGL